MNSILLVFIGGGLGSITRFGFSKLIHSGISGINPAATFVSNLLSTTILGILLFLVSEKIEFNTNLKLLLITGFCGGFSTFSTFSFETFELIKSGYFMWALLNIGVSLVLSISVLLILAKIT